MFADDHRRKIQINQTDVGVIFICIQTELEGQFDRKSIEIFFAFVNDELFLLLKKIA